MTDRNTPDVPSGGTDGVSPLPPKRSNEPLVLALIGLAVAVLLFVASALPVILSRDDSSDDQTTAPLITVTTIASTDSSDDVDTVTPSDSADGSTETTPEATTDSATDSTDPDGVGDLTSTTTDGGDQAANGDEVPESRAIVLAGKIYLEGAVPDEESRAAIVALAAEILGPDNVIDNYIIDPRASDPNLGNIRVDDAVLFATDSAVIAPDFEPLLNQGLALLTIRPAATFIIEGHTDSRGSDQYNARLSQQRADAIVWWYAERGIDSSRLTAIGRGETEPIAFDDTAEGRQLNRRIEVTIENLLSDPA